MSINTSISGSGVGASGSGGSNGGHGGGSGGGGGGGGPCGACKFLRRKCVVECIFAPYFDSEQGAALFAAVHKVFGASNVSKMLLYIPVHKRPEAVITICFEAQARLRDPVYGCVGHIFALQQQVASLQSELNCLQTQLRTLEHPTPAAQPVLLPPPPLPPPPPPPLSRLDLATTSPLLLTSSAYDLSSFFDPMVQQQQHQHHVSWSMPLPSQMDILHFGGAGVANSNSNRPPLETTSSSSYGGNGDLQELARQLLQRNEQSPPLLLPHSH